MDLAPGCTPINLGSLQHCTMSSKSPKLSQEHPRLLGAQPLLSFPILFSCLQATFPSHMSPLQKAPSC